jgi:hypothetical protein
VKRDFRAKKSVPDLTPERDQLNQDQSHVLIFLSCHHLTYGKVFIGFMVD